MPKSTHTYVHVDTELLVYTIHMYVCVYINVLLAKNMCIVHNANESRQYGSEYLATANVMQAISHRTRREDNK